MRYRYVIAIIVVALAVLSVGAVNAPKIDSGPARIKVTGVLKGTREIQHHKVSVYYLFNRPAFPNRLGTAVVKCLDVSPLWAECSVAIRLGRGVVIGSTLSPRVAGFRNYAITGGTGHYSNVGGEMFVQPLGSELIFVINLIGFSSF